MLTAENRRRLEGIIAEMRSKRIRYKSHDLGLVDSVSSNLVDEWADELAELAAAVALPDAPAEPQDALVHPVSQVYFRAGLLACREYMARFVEAESPAIAMSIRANWWPSLGRDYGPPRLLEFNEVTAGEFGAAGFRTRTSDEVSPTQEALPIALGFLQQQAVAPPSPQGGPQETP